MVRWTVTRYFWPKMAEEINRHVQACSSCQARKGIPQKQAPEFLQSIYVEQPFQKIGIDLLGPYPLSEFKNWNIIAAVKYLTKWEEAAALPTGITEDVVTFFMANIFLRHWGPREIVSNRGNFFVSD